MAYQGYKGQLMAEREVHFRHLGRRATGGEKERDCGKGSIEIWTPLVIKYGTPSHAIVDALGI